MQGELIVRHRVSQTLKHIEEFVINRMSNSLHMYMYLLISVGFTHTHHEYDTHILHILYITFKVLVLYILEHFILPLHIQHIAH